MSTILKALKRLDDERRAEKPVRTLEDQVLGGARVASRRRRRVPWLPLLGGASVVVLAGGLALWLAPGSEAPPAAGAQAEQVAAGETAAPSAASVERPEPATPPRATAGTATPALREMLRTNAIPAAQAPAPPPEYPPATGALGSVAEIEREAARAEAQAEPPLQGAAAPPAAPQPSAAPREVANERAPDPELAREPSVAVIPPRPEVWVDRTQWHPSPEKRRAWVRVGPRGEAREVKESDSIDGVLVKEIKPSGVVFAAQGEEWRRGVGSN